MRSGYEQRTLWLKAVGVTDEDVCVSWVGHASCRAPGAREEVITPIGELMMQLKAVSPWFTGQVILWNKRRASLVR